MKFSRLYLSAGLIAASANAADKMVVDTAHAIPWNQIGAKAGADYKGDGLSVTRTDSGARLHCVFQRLDGNATSEGLWLNSTVENALCDRFRVTASELNDVPLADTGRLSADGQTARFVRPQLIEEYSVNMDGIRQDFIIPTAPTPREASWSAPVLWRFFDDNGQTPFAEKGELILNLSVSGATVEPAADGATLILENSGRHIAYNRLRVTDATGKDLTARIEVAPQSEIRNPQSAITLSIVIDDTDTLYPIRIDPTFSDANWVSMGDTPYVNSFVQAATVDSSGNLYIGGEFTQIGHVSANLLAKWDGTNWSSLGEGLSGLNNNNVAPQVSALLCSGNVLYVGGQFSTAGGNPANGIAAWDGTNWSALGSGISGTHGTGSGPQVNALAISGGILYAGGAFTNAGGMTANNIAQWDGNNWSSVSSGTSGATNGIAEFSIVSGVYALAVSGNTLYAGGYFTNAGGTAANSIAQWDGSAWSPLGSGVGYPGSGTSVRALAIFSGKLYAGGTF